MTVLSVMVFPSTLKEGLGEIAFLGSTDLMAFQNLSGKFEECFNIFVYLVGPYYAGPYWR